MKISACIIVKNEEKVISRCLSCLKKFADEIIVVDTGSSDSTKDIVLKFTDNIYDFKWIYDFSAARNYAFSLAKCDYVFWLDADDFISDISAEKIAAIKNEKEPFDTYMMKYAVGFDNAGKPSFEFYRERLMRNCPNARFKGFVHEAIAPFGRIKRCDITIEHRKEKEGDPRRNLNLYERHLSLGEKLDARGQYYYAKEFFFLGEYTRCEKELLKYLTMSNKFLPDEKDAYISVYKCRKKTGKGDIAAPLFSALSAIGPDAEIFCYLGDAESDQKRMGRAAAYYKCALCSDFPKENYGFFEQRFFYLEPLLRLVALYYRAGDKRSAKLYHDICKEKYPDDEAVIYNSRFFD